MTTPASFGSQRAGVFHRPIVTWILQVLLSEIG